MPNYEYKTVRVPMKGIFKRDVDPELSHVLNAEGRKGWRLANSVVPAGSLGESEQVVLIFIREAG